MRIGAENQAIYTAKTHHNFRNYMRTVWNFWYTGQGLSDTQSIKHLPLAFANNALMRDHIYDLILANSTFSLKQIIDKIIEETGLGSGGPRSRLQDSGSLMLVTFIVRKTLRE